MILYAAGGVTLAYALLLGAYLFTLRLEAVPNELRLRSLFGTRQYRLRRGNVNRLTVKFARRPLEARVAGLGVRFGEGQLGGERLVDVIALDNVPSLVMVPVEGGRLAVAAEPETVLLEAVRRAAQNGELRADVGPDESR